eukprot:10238717-Lingulodinium_polyedra.AAC.1
MATGHIDELITKAVWDAAYDELLGCATAVPAPGTTYVAFDDIPHRVAEFLAFALHDVLTAYEQSPRDEAAIQSAS